MLLVLCMSLADEKQILQCNFKHIFPPNSNQIISTMTLILTDILLCPCLFFTQCFPDCEPKSDLINGSDCERQCISHDLRMKTVASQKGNFTWLLGISTLKIKLLPYIVCHMLLVWYHVA